MLQFKSSSQKLFYWLQEASTVRDQIILQHVNSLIHSQEDEEEYLDEDAAMEDVEGTGKCLFWNWTYCMDCLVGGLRTNSTDIFCFGK